MLPGSETSDDHKSVGSPLEDEAEVWPDEERQGRWNCRLSEREADRHPGTTRVRFEIAGRAHQRECTPRLGINLGARSCQEERGVKEENCAKKANLGMKLHRERRQPSKKKKKLIRIGRVMEPRAAIWRREKACVRAKALGACSRQDRGRDSFW